MEELSELIEMKKYFIMHAPRQTGKTSTLKALEHKLNLEGKYHALYVNIELAQSFRENISAAMEAIVNEIGRRAIELLNDNFILEQLPELKKQGSEGTLLNSILTDWCRHLKKPLILLIDEIDSLIGDTLVSVLRQLRAGYDKRPQSFPQSVILCGVRDIKDYKIHASSEKEIITGGSCFNIKAASLRLGCFSAEETEELLLQHTKETGQVFAPEAIAEIYRLSGGQPWLVNALAYELCFDNRQNRDRSIKITKEMVTAAKEKLILQRQTHIDQLMDKLKEERVRQVMQPILLGAESFNADGDNILYCEDLGLLKYGVRPPEIANPIYKEVLPRELSDSFQQTLYINNPDFIENGLLNMEKLMQRFISFYRENAHQEFFNYEIVPHILLMAFLQRIINGGGHIIREYALGRKRMDLGVFFGEQRFAIEIKMKKKGTQPLKEGKEQLSTYMDSLGLQKDGWLLIFDPDIRKPWSRRFKEKTIKHADKTIRVLEM
jgi:hypothetical protein